MLPFCGGLACALGSNAEMEGGCLLSCLCQAVGHAGVLGAVDGDAAHLLEYAAQGPKEPFLLHEEIALHAFGAHVELANEKVPVAGVWSQADNVFVGMGLCHHFPPSHKSI